MGIKDPAVIRLAYPLALSAYLEHIGASAEAYFRRQGLPLLSRNPDFLVPLHSAWRLYNDAAQREDRFIGWHAGRFAGDSTLSAALLIRLESASTLYQALRKLIQLATCEASHLQLGIIERRSDILFLTHYLGMREKPGYFVSQAYQIQVYIDLVRHFAGASWEPAEIGIEAPEYSPLLNQQFPTATSASTAEGIHIYFTLLPVQKAVHPPQTVREIRPSVSDR